MILVCSVIISVLADHDISSRPYKARFAANSEVPNRYQQLGHGVGIQLTMPGIPSISYGTEQALDGNQGYHDYAIEPEHAYIDRYVREAMFGGKLEAFGTEGCHFFDPVHPTVLVEVSKGNVPLSMGLDVYCAKRLKIGMCPKEFECQYYD